MHNERIECNQTYSEPFNTLLIPIVPKGTARDNNENMDENTCATTWKSTAGYIRQTPNFLL